MNERAKKHKRIPWGGILLACGVLVLGHLTAFGLNGEALFSHWFPVLGDCRYITLPAVLVIFLVFSFALYRYRYRLFGVRSLSRAECEPRCAMILCLSPADPRPENDRFDFDITVTKEGKQAVLHGNSLDKDIAELDDKGVRWNWQQLLRALETHRSKLKYVYIIGSDGEDGSQEDVGHAKKMIEAYCPDVDVDSTSSGVDFESFYDLLARLEGGIDKCKKKGFDEQDIIIDVTGGFKTASIAGAATTLNRHVRFQYITSSRKRKEGEPPYRCWSYEITYLPPAGGE